MQLRLDVAPPVSRPRTPLRQQRNLEERAQVRGTLKQVMSSLVVVGDSTFFFRSLPSQNLGKYLSSSLSVYLIWFKSHIVEITPPLTPPRALLYTFKVLY